MENVPVARVAGGGLSFDIPDAVKLIGVTGVEAKKLAHLALHRSDLAFARHCLEALQKYDEKEHVEVQALWRGAIIYCVKCFMGNSPRARLEEATVLADEPVAREWLRYFTELRNKHLVHDVNSFSQSAVFAALNDGTKSYKVVVASTFTVSSLNQHNFDSLCRLVEKSMKWVEKESDLLCSALRMQLEACSYEELSACGSPFPIHLPKLKDLDRRRKTP
jgi:hypothetical protein